MISGAEGLALRAGNEISHTAAKRASAFLESVSKGVGEALGGVFADKLNFRRFRNLIPIVLEAKRLLAENGLTVHEIPLKVIHPLLEAASLEEDPDLQELWANLLANAADSRQQVTVTTQYASILRELKPSDARFFQYYVEEYKEPKTGSHREATTAAAYRAGLARRQVGTVGRWMGYESEEAMRDGEKNIALAIDTLCRVGLMQKISQVEAIDSRQIAELVERLVKGNAIGTLKIDTELTPGPTQLGVAFLEAVQAPTP